MLFRSVFEKDFRKGTVSTKTALAEEQQGQPVDTLHHQVQVERAVTSSHAMKERVLSMHQRTDRRQSTLVKHKKRTLRDVSGTDDTENGKVTKKTQHTQYTSPVTPLSLKLRVDIRGPFHRAVPAIVDKVLNADHMRGIHTHISQQPCTDGQSDRVDIHCNYKTLDRIGIYHATFEDEPAGYSKRYRLLHSIGKEVYRELHDLTGNPNVPVYLTTVEKEGDTDTQITMYLDDMM